MIHYAKERYTQQADTLTELATKIHIDPKVLEQTVAIYNDYVRAEEDGDFGRSSMAMALDKGQYYAIKMVPGIHNTMGGVAINTKA